MRSELIGLPERVECRRVPEAGDSAETENIEDLDMKFEDILDGICDNCRYDVKFKDNLGEGFPRLEEFKSYKTDTWASINGNGKFIKQFKAYLSAPEVSKIEDLAYVVNSRKVTINEVRSAFKALFESQKEEIFALVWERQDLRNSLLTKVNEVDALREFEQLVLSTESKLYKFIKMGQ